MSLFLDHLWLWIVLAFVVGTCGYAWYISNRSNRSLIVAIAAPILTFALGLTLYYGVDTDRKSIVRMLNALIAAVERDDAEAVDQFISPRAENVRQTTRAGMRLAVISRARYRNLEIAVNDATSPPIANVRLTGVFYWRSKQDIGGFFTDQPIYDSVHVEFELIKTRDNSWHITDNFRYRFRHSQ